MRTESRTFILTILLLGALVFAAPSGYAQQDSSALEVGFLYGPSITDADNTKAYRVQGIRASTFAMAPFALGGYMLESDASGEANGRSFTYGLYGIEGAYNIAGGRGRTKISLRLGMSKVATQHDGVDLVASPYHYGLVSGYDYKLASWISIGIEGSYIHVLKDETDYQSATYTDESFNVMNFLLALQFYFF